MTEKKSRKISTKKPYKRNFLSRVIFRLDFLESIPIGNLKEFSEEIKDYFYNKKENRGLTSIFNDNNESRQHHQEISSWIFNGRENKKDLAVSMKFLYIDYKNYKNSEELFGDIEKVVNKFINRYGIEIIGRIGLRYLNEIKIEEKNQLDWTKYLNKNLISGLEFIKDNKKIVSRAMNHLAIKEELGDINFQYGIWNNDFPNEINRKEFILDFDCFNTSGIESEDLLEVAKKYNQYIGDLFEASITNDFRKLLNS